MSLSVYNRSVVTSTGDVVASASVEVRLDSDNSLAAIFSDAAGTTALPNPMTANSAGFFQFFVAAGRYTVEGGNGITSTTWTVDLGTGSASVDLATTTTTTTATVTNSGGTDAVIPQATTSKAGVISNVEKVKLDEFEVVGDNMEPDGGVALANNKYIRGWDNSANTDFVNSSHPLIGLDADQNVVLGPSDPHFHFVLRIPFWSSKRQGHWEAYRMYDASTAVMRANGLNATQLSSGGTLSLAENGSRAFWQVATGSAGVGDGYLIEAPNMTQTLGAFGVFGAQFEVLQTTNFTLEAGLWDGTTANRIAFYWDVGNSSSNFTLRCSSGGAVTAVGAGQGSGSTARWHIRIHNIDDSNIELMTSTSGVALGEFVTRATASSNLPTTGLYPYIRFVNRVTALSRTGRFDQIYNINGR